MLHEFSREELLLGADALQKLASSHVAVFGIGGVGSFACEALARAGVGELTLIDNDTVSLTNRNRQLIALVSTTGQAKVEVMRERIADINPRCTVHALQQFYTPDSTLDLTQFDYVIDAIDTVTAKLHLISECDRLGVPLICSMGTGNKLDPTRFEVADIYKTSVCPLARVIRLDMQKTPDSPSQGGLLQGRSPHSPSLGGTKRHRRPCRPRQRILRSAGCRYDSCGRSYQSTSCRVAALSPHLAICLLP